MNFQTDELPHGSMLLIEGITQDGATFRPNDWAERMGGSLASFKNHRIDYSPMLFPQVVHGHKCLIVAMTLKDKHPELFEQVIGFATKNHLKMRVKAPD